jgi:hypothetical protein
MVLSNVSRCLRTPIQNDLDPNPYNSDVFLSENLWMAEIMPMPAMFVPPIAQPLPTVKPLPAIKLLPTTVRHQSQPYNPTLRR